MTALTWSREELYAIMLAESIIFLCFVFSLFFPCVGCYSIADRCCHLFLNYIVCKYSWTWLIFILELLGNQRPHGKESTEVQITQKIGKERENSYWKMKRSLDESHTRKQNEIFRWPQMPFSTLTSFWSTKASVISKIFHSVSTWLSSRDLIIFR